MAFTSRGESSPPHLLALVIDDCKVIRADKPRREFVAGAPFQQQLLLYLNLNYR